MATVAMPHNAPKTLAPPTSRPAKAITAASSLKYTMLMWYQPKPKIPTWLTPRTIWIATAAWSPSSGLMPYGTRARPGSRVTTDTTRMTASAAITAIRPARVDGNRARPQRAGTSRRLPARNPASRMRMPLAIHHFPAVAWFWSWTWPWTPHRVRRPIPQAASDAARHRAKAQSRPRPRVCPSSADGSGGNAPGTNTAAAARKSARLSQKEPRKRMTASAAPARSSARRHAASGR